MLEVNKLGYDPSFLYKHFPTLCSSISARYMAYVRSEREARENGLARDVRAATSRVHARGEYPSYRRVMRELNRPRVMREPEALVHWRAALREEGWNVAEWKNADGA